MNQRMPPVPMQRGQFYWESHGRGDSLEWVIFALLLLLIALVVALLVLSVMRRGGPGGPRHTYKLHGPPGSGPWGRPNALDVARVRYAQGAIGRDEYLQLVEDLGGEPEPPPPPPA